MRTNGQAACYWRDVGTVDAYWAANMDLTDIVPQLDFYDRSWPIWTFAPTTPPAKFVHDQDVIKFLTEKHALRLKNIKTGEACTEFVFERPMTAGQAIGMPPRS